MSDEQAPYDWSAFYDAEGNIYYYNSVSGESAWDAPEKFNPPPAKEEAAAEGGSAEEVQQPASSEGAATGTWTAHKTDDGQEYFYNAETGETTWEQPEGVVIRDDEEAAAAGLSPERQESPSTAAILMDVDETKPAGDDEEQKPEVEEKKEEVVVEIDPAEKAEAALKNPDAVMERGRCYQVERCL